MTNYAAYSVRIYTSKYGNLGSAHVFFSHHNSHALTKLSGCEDTRQAMANPSSLSSPSISSSIIIIIHSILLLPQTHTLTSFLPCMDVRRTWTHTSIMLLIYPQILGWFLIYKPAGNGQRHRPAMSIVHVYTKPASSFAHIAILPPDVYNTDK